MEEQIALRKEEMVKKANLKVEAYQRILDFLQKQIWKNNPQRQKLLNNAFQNVLIIHKNRVESRIRIEETADALIKFLSTQVIGEIPEEMQDTSFLTADKSSTGEPKITADKTNAKLIKPLAYMNQDNETDEDIITKENISVTDENVIHEASNRNQTKTSIEQWESPCKKSLQEFQPTIVEDDKSVESPYETSLLEFQPTDTHRTATTILEDDESILLTDEEDLSITEDKSVSITDEDYIITASTDKHSMSPKSIQKLPYQEALQGPNSSMRCNKASMPKLQVMNQQATKGGKFAKKSKQSITANFKGKSPYQQSLRTLTKQAVQSKCTVTTLKVASKVTDKSVKEVSKTKWLIPSKPKWKSPYAQSLRPPSKSTIQNRMSMSNLEVASIVTDYVVKEISENKQLVPPKPTWESPYKQSLLRPRKSKLRSKTCLSNLTAASKVVNREASNNKQPIIPNFKWKSPYKRPLHGPKVSTQNQNHVNLEVTSRMTDRSVIDTGKNKQLLTLNFKSQSSYKAPLQAHKPSVRSQSSMPNLHVINRDSRKVTKCRSITSNTKWKSPYEQSLRSLPKPPKRNQISMSNPDISSEETDDSITESDNNKLANPEKVLISALRPAIQIQTDRSNVNETDENIAETDENVTETGKKGTVALKSNWKALLHVLKPAIQTQKDETDLEATNEEAVENARVASKNKLITYKPKNTHELQVPKLTTPKVTRLNLEITSEETDDSITESDNNKLGVTPILRNPEKVLISALRPAIQIQTDTSNVKETNESITETDESITGSEKRPTIAPKSNWKALLQVLRAAAQTQMGKTDLETSEEAVENASENKLVIRKSENMHKLQVSKLATSNVTSRLNLEISSEETDTSIIESDVSELTLSAKLKLELPDKVLSVPKLDLRNLYTSTEEIDENVTKPDNKKSVITAKSKLKLFQQTSVPILKPAIPNQKSVPNLEISNIETDKTVTQADNKKLALTPKFKLTLIAALQPAIRNQTNASDLISTKETGDSVKEHLKSQPIINPKSNWKAILQILKPAASSQNREANLEINDEGTDKFVRETSCEKYLEVKPAIGNLEPNNDSILRTNENISRKTCNSKEGENNRALSLATFQQVSVDGTTSSKTTNKTNMKIEENYKTSGDTIEEPLNNIQSETEISEEVSMESNIKSFKKPTGAIKEKEPLNDDKTQADVSEVLDMENTVKSSYKFTGAIKKQRPLKDVTLDEVLSEEIHMTSTIKSPAKSTGAIKKKEPLNDDKTQADVSEVLYMENTVKSSYKSTGTIKKQRPLKDVTLDEVLSEEIHVTSTIKSSAKSTGAIKKKKPLKDVSQDEVLSEEIDMTSTIKAPPAKSTGAITKKMPLTNDKFQTVPSEEVDSANNIKSSAKSTGAIKKKFPIIIEIDPVAEANKAKDKGDSFIAVGQFQKAIEQYSRAIAFTPDDPSCFYRRAVVYNCLQMYPQCILDSEKVIKLDPKYAKIYSLVGMAYSSLDMHGQAYQAFSQALIYDPNNVIVRASYELITEKIYGKEIEKARINELCYLTYTYEQYNRDPEILDVALLILKEPSANNVASTLLLNSHTEQQSNIINTLKCLRERMEVTVPLYNLPLEYQREDYSKEEKMNGEPEKEENIESIIPKIGALPEFILQNTNADLMKILFQYKKNKEKRNSAKQEKGKERNDN